MNSDKRTIIKFDRNSPQVPPQVSLQVPPMYPAGVPQIPSRCPLGTLQLLPKFTSGAP